MSTTINAEIIQTEQLVEYYIPLVFVDGRWDTVQAYNSMPVNRIFRNQTDAQRYLNEEDCDRNIIAIVKLPVKS